MTNEEFKLALDQVLEIFGRNKFGAQRVRQGVYILEQQLAASQLREQKYMEALERLDAWLRQRYHVGLVPSERELLEQSKRQDTSALEALIAKAGEHMRERCVAKCIEIHEYAIPANPAEECSVSIRAIPSVTLEDLK